MSHGGETASELLANGDLANDAMYYADEDLEEDDTDGFTWDDGHTVGQDQDKYMTNEGNFEVEDDDDEPQYGIVLDNKH